MRSLSWVLLFGCLNTLVYLHKHPTVVMSPASLRTITAEQEIRGGAVTGACHKECQRRMRYRRMLLGRMIFIHYQWRWGCFPSWALQQLLFNSLNKWWKGKPEVHVASNFMDYQLHNLIKTLNIYSPSVNM